jgi:hypothetical protein
MVSKTRHYLTTLLCLFAAASAHSQQPPEPKPLAHTGSVDGYVTFAETRLPARFAEIRLVPKPTDTPASPTPDLPAQNVPAQDQTTGDQPQPHVSVVSGISDMEGRFHLEGIPAGDYLAAALMPGFAGPGIDPATNPTDEQLKPIIASLPTVRVSEGQTATVNLTLHRGGVITGRVLYSDGSPATGIQVSYQASVLATFSQISMRRISPLVQTMLTFISRGQVDHSAKTDDFGRYRIFGLSPGKYVVVTALASQRFPSRVTMNDGTGFGGASPNRAYEFTTVYAPGVFRRTDARVFEIRGDEEITDADLKLDPSGLHNVKGRVLAGEDRHVPSQAMIWIKENGKPLDRMSTLEPDGSFEVDYLPSGTYTLQIFGTDMQPLPQYQMADQAVIVETQDVTLGEVVLVALKPGEKQQFPQ